MATILSRDFSPAMSETARGWTPSFSAMNSNTAAFALQPIYTFGNAARNSVMGPAGFSLDFATHKDFRIREGHDLQFRVEAFNVLNHPNFANPFGGQNGWAHNDPSTGSFGCACATPDVAASNPVIGSGGSRAIQLGLKLSF